MNCSDASKYPNDVVQSFSALMDQIDLIDEKKQRLIQTVNDLFKQCQETSLQWVQAQKRLSESFKDFFDQTAAILTKEKRHFHHLAESKLTNKVIDFLCTKISEVFSNLIVNVSVCCNKGQYGALHMLDAFKIDGQSILPQEEKKWWNRLVEYILKFCNLFNDVDDKIKDSFMYYYKNNNQSLGLLCNQLSKLCEKLDKLKLLNSDISNLEQSKKKSEREINELQSNINKLKKNETSLNTKCREMEGRWKCADLKYKQVRQQLESAYETLQSKKEEIDVFRTALKDEREQWTQHQNELIKKTKGFLDQITLNDQTKMESENAEWKQAISELQTRLMQLQGSYGLMDENLENQLDYQNNQLSGESLNQFVNLLESAKQFFDTNLMQKMDGYQRLQTELDLMMQDAQKLRNQNDEYREKISEYEKKLEESNVIRSDLEESVKKSEAQLKELFRECQTAIEDRDNLILQLDALNNNKKALEKNLEEKTKHYNDEVEKFNEKSNECIAIKEFCENQCNQYLAKIKELRNQMNKKQDESESLIKKYKLKYLRSKSGRKNLASKVNELNLEISRLENKIKELDKKNNDAEDRERAINNLKKELADLNLLHSDSQEKLKEFKLQYEKEYQLLLTKADQQVKHIKELKDSIDKLTHDNNLLAQQTNSLEIGKENLESQFHYNKIELNRIQSDYSVQEKQILDLTSQIKNLIKEKDNLHNKLDLKNKDSTEEKIKYEKFVLQYDKLRDELNEKNIGLQNMEKTISDLQLKTTTLEQQKNDTTLQLQELRSKNKNLSMELDAEKQKLIDAENHLRLIKSDFESLQQEQKSLEKLNVNLESQLQNKDHALSQVRYNDKTEELDQLSQALQQTQEDLKKCQRQLEEKTQYSSQVDDKIAKLNIQFEQKEQELNILGQDKEKIASQYAGMNDRLQKLQQENGELQQKQRILEEQKQENSALTNKLNQELKNQQQKSDKDKLRLKTIIKGLFSKPKKPLERSCVLKKASHTDSPKHQRSLLSQQCDGGLAIKKENKEVETSQEVPSQSNLKTTNGDLQKDNDLMQAYIKQLHLMINFFFQQAQVS